MAVSRAVLITGCSTGIGRATAERLASSGWRVYATARNVDAISDLAERGCELLPLDMADEDSMRTAVRRPRARYAVTPSAHLFIWLRRLLPDRAWDAMVGTVYPRPGGGP